MRSSKTGTIIAIDGPDGVGKSTQIELLSKHLKANGKTIHVTRASGGTPIGEELRKASLSLHPRPVETDLYISLAMHTALGYDLKKRKSAGEFVLVDRSPLTIVAYQVFGNHLSPSTAGYEACVKMLKLWDADILFMLEAPQSILDKRRQKRVKATDYFEEKSVDYHHRVQMGYTKAVQAAKELHLPLEIITIDAQPSVAAINRNILQHIL